jgi:hypothetical protein
VKRRVRLATLLVAVLATSLTACAKEKTGDKEVKAAIAATHVQPLRFVYSVSSPEAAYQVQGLVEDDFRYKARLVRDSQTVLDEVVNDDAIAVRFAQPSLLGAFVDDTQRASADLDTDLAGVSVVDVLRAKRWVLDSKGAPVLTDASRSVNNVNRDPVFDALGVFSYVERAMTEAFEVHRWDPDDLNPAYRASEDVFPQPKKGSGVTRFDLRRPFLPAIGVASGTASDSFPQTKHFRKMAIYVKDGRIIRVMERVELTGKAGDDFIGYLKRFAKQAGATDEEIEKGLEELKDLDDRQRSDLLLTALNQVLDATGQNPIAVRTMTLDLRDIGARDIKAELPTDTIEGSLAILLNRGKKVEAASASGSPTAPAASQSAKSPKPQSTTSTTDAP